MANGKFGVMVQFQGKRPNVVMVEGGATVRSALRDAGHNPEQYAGRVTLNNKKADLSDRIATNALLSISENVAGGSR